MGLSLQRAKASDHVLNLSNFNKMMSCIEALWNITVTGNLRLTKGAIFSLTSTGGGDFDASLFVFGYSVSGAVVTVSKGYCQHATRGTLISVEQDVTIATDHQFVVLNYVFGYVFGSGALTLSLSNTYPLPDGNTWRKPLHQWRLINGVASLEMFFPGNLEIPGAYA